MANEEVDPKYGADFPQTLHERARSSATEQRRLLISLATASLGVFFIALTNAETELTILQKVAVILGLAFMTLAATGGILAWEADAERNYFWAKALQAKDPKERESLDLTNKKWHATMKWCDRVLKLCFPMGILASVLYIFARLVA